MSISYDPVRSYCMTYCASADFIATGSLQHLAFRGREASMTRQCDSLLRENMNSNLLRMWELGAQVFSFLFWCVRGRPGHLCHGLHRCPSPGLGRMVAKWEVLGRGSAAIGLHKLHFSWPKTIPPEESASNPRARVFEASAGLVVRLIRCGQGLAAKAACLHQVFICLDKVERTLGQSFILPRSACTFHLFPESKADVIKSYVSKTSS